MAVYEDKPEAENQIVSENSRLKAQVEHLEAQNAAMQTMMTHHLEFMQSLNIISYATDLQWTPRYYHGAIQSISAYEERVFINQLLTWEQLIHPEDLPSFQVQRQNFLKQGLNSISMEYRIISGEGQICWVNDMLALLRDQDNNPQLVQGVIVDITRRKLAEEELLERQAHLDSILNSVQDVIWSVTPDTFDLLYINPAAEKLYSSVLNCAEPSSPLSSIGHKELLLENFDTLLSRGSFEAEYCVNLANGEKRWLQRRAHFARDAHGLVARIDGRDTDITRRKQAEESLRYISLHDGLTDLYNRFYFEDQLQLIDNSPSKTAGLIVCDVDGLKAVNDQKGHAMGDRLLIQCAQILKNCFQADNEIISRIGGDEFTVLLMNASLESLLSAVSKLRQTIIRHNESDIDFPISISIGQAIKRSAEISMSEVFRQADDMMYAEKFSNR